jgi:hypothetical protein
VSDRKGTIWSVSIHVRNTVKGRRYDVRLRSGDGIQHSKTFATKREATESESRQVAALADGIFIALGPERRRWPTLQGDGSPQGRSGTRLGCGTARS